MKRYWAPVFGQALRALSHAKDGMIPRRFRLRRMAGFRSASLGDSRWLELQFRPNEALADFGIRLPSLPPDDVQRRFTGRCGRDNLTQAFSFYKFACLASNLKRINEPNILDFGGGWGRISRFFLRETKPDHIWIADCLGDAIHWLHETANPCNIVKNETYPPIAGLTSGFDLVYAFSVFSHLSEQYMRAWLDYLMGLLRPGGHLVFSTRGRDFIDSHERRHREGGSPSSSYLLEKLPPPDQLRARYLKGEFQFYPTGGGGELAPDFYGETLIPRSYVEKNYHSSFVDFTEQIEDVDQAVVVLRR